MKRILSIIGVLALIMTMALFLSACQGGGTGSGDNVTGGSSGGNTPVSGNGNSEDTQAEQPSPTPETKLPESLTLHPDAYDMDFNETSGTYIYYVPMMVKETTDYFLVEQEAKGWEKLGTPTVMGHIATLTFKMGTSRLTISMQDNEHTESTRVQMLIMHQ